MKPSIFIADDHPLTLKGLKNLLEEKGYNVIGTAENGQVAYANIVKQLPDIVILDIEMPFITGIEIARMCQANHINTKVILLTLHKEPELYRKAIKLNISGYILKEFALDEILECLEEVIKGNRFFSKKIKESLQIKENKKGDKILENLTPSEKRILKLIATGKNNKEIAHLLFISYRTVEKHRSNIIVKLKLPNKSHALLLWVEGNKHLLH